MRVVVTGASGNVGTALLRRLAREPEVTSVLGVARRVPDCDAEPYRSAEWLACDVGRAEAPARLAAAFRGADAVVHLAWAIQPRRDEPPAERTNLTGSDHVLRAAGEAGVAVLACASSVGAYSPAPPGDGRVDEGWPCGGVAGSAYSRQKAWLEGRLDAFEREHPGVLVARIRPCGIAQRDAASEMARFTVGPLPPTGLVGRLRLPGPLPALLPLPLPPGLRMQLVHSDDVAAALWRILTRRVGGAFNLAAEPVLPAAELAAHLGAWHLPVPAPLLERLAWGTWRIGLQPLHPGWLRLARGAPLLDTRRARALLDWTPAHDAGAVLDELVAGLRQHVSRPSVPLAPRASLPVRLRRLVRGQAGTQSQA